MVVNFQFTLDDYRNAFRAHYRKGASAFTRWMLRVVLVIGMLLLLLSVLFVITGQRALNVVLPPLFLGAFWTLDRDGEDLSTLRQKPVRKKSGIAGAKTH